MVVSESLHSYQYTLTQIPTTIPTTIPTQITQTPISVSSTPSGASVYLDGYYKGKTPISIPSVYYGTHSLKLIYPGYQDVSYSVVVSDSSHSYQYTLNPIATVQTIQPIAVITASQTVSYSPSTPIYPSPPELLVYAGLSVVVLIIFLYIVLKLKKSQKNRDSKSGLPENIQPLSKSSLRKRFPMLILILKPVMPNRIRSDDLPQNQNLVRQFPDPLLPKYEPLDFIGEGGFAKVFKVKRKSDGLIVAIKIPRIEEKTSGLFLKEVATWYHLNHPNIVRLYSVELLPIPYIEMEYVEGCVIEGKIQHDLDKYPETYR